MFEKFWRSFIMISIQFCKYHGAGNDFIVFDNRGDVYSLTDETRRHMCDRHFGIGADGIVEIKLSQSDDFKVIYYNADGKVGSLCGNGCRCALAYAKSLGIVSFAGTLGDCALENPECQGQSVYTFEASTGRHVGIIQETVKRGVNLVEYFVKFGDFLASDIKQYNAEEFYINTGSPHHVKFITNELENMNVFKAGRKLSYELYGDKGSNINFVQSKRDNQTIKVTDEHSPETWVKAKDNNVLYVRTYERGVENETLACGTGAVAIALIQHAKDANVINMALNSQTSDASSNTERVELVRITIEMKGGKLTVTFKAVINDQGPSVLYKDVYLSGPAQYVFRGVYEMPQD
uniref:Diaminopimelate epimerase n=1 Tax=Biomphalaria glabrata TaxID=6526 RepID=A0A2C9LIQ8_BIOGL